MRRAAASFLIVLTTGCKHAEGDRTPTSADAGTTASPDAGGPAPTARGWWTDAVFYEVFVRSFADSNGDGKGDLRGLTAKLDVLNDGDPSTTTDLGVTGLWLMPIQPSPSYHGYDVTNYRDVNPDYGTLADFDALIAAAHQRGIKVIIDYVLNHASLAHPYFSDPTKRDWFVWRADDPGWHQPWGNGPVWHARNGAYYYAIFWSGMPDWNLANPAVEAEHVESLRFWLDRGVDGFRVDAARHLFESPTGELSDQPETHAFVKRVRAALAPDHPDALWVAEAWTSLATVAKYHGEGGNEFQLAFGFDTAGAIKTSAKDGNRADVNQALQAAARDYEDRAFEAPFLANHDMDRVMRVLGSDAPAMRVAAASYLTLPGTPFLYYGEEIGMVGGPTTADEDKRTPMRWTAEGGFTTGTPWRTVPEAAGVDVASQRGVAGSLWTLYRDLIALRRAHPALVHGETTQPVIEGAGRGVANWLREDAASRERILFVANYHGEAAPAFQVAVAGAPVVLFAEGLTGVTARDGKLAFAGLGPRGFAIVAVQ